MIPLRDANPSRRLPVVMGLLILVNALVFLVELSWPPQQQERMFYDLGLVPARYFGPPGDVMPVGGMAAPSTAAYLWPFLTHMFLHAGWLHVLSNMWILWIFGDNVEDRMGHGRFLLFYLICGLAAAGTQMFLSRGSDVPMVGASGAIAGVLGAYVLLYPLAQVLVVLPILFYPWFFRVPALVYIAIWFGLQLLSGTQALSSAGQEGPGVAWWAHVGGFLAGMALCPLLARRPRGARERT